MFEALIPGESARATVPLDPEDPPLRDHQVGQRALVPAAMWVDAMQRLAHALDPQASSWQLDDFVIHGPTFVQAPRDDVRATAERTDDNAFRIEVRVGDAVVAEALLRPAPSPPFQSICRARAAP